MSERLLRWRRRLKPLARRLGLTSAHLWQPFALARYHGKQRRNADYRAWLASRGERWISEHWGHYVVEDEFTREHLASQLFELTELLRHRLGPLDDSVRVLDAGASDGAFLSLLGARHGVGVNFLIACARRIRDDGQCAVAADVERLPFASRSVDYVICCETLEHVANPIWTLNELARVCRRRIFVTIPWLPATRINARPPGWPEEEGHVFEFSEADFVKVLTHTSVRMTHSGFVQVFPEPRNPLLRWWLGIWMYPWYFPKLQYYELEPVIERN